MLDIDETSLSNWLEIDQDDFAFIPSGACILQPGFTCGELQWELSARAEALKPTLNLFNAARSWGVAIFFVTGRQDRFDLRDATVTNLKRRSTDATDPGTRPVTNRVWLPGIETYANSTRSWPAGPPRVVRKRFLVTTNTVPVHVAVAGALQLIGTVAMRERLNETGKPIVVGES